MSSSFLLDTSRRILIPGPTTNKIPSSLYGELSADCLKGIGFTYKEEFASGHKELEKSVNNVMKPVTTALNALMKALPVGPGVSIDGANDLRAKAIEAYALLKTVEGKDNLQLSELLDQFNYVYSYNIPMRKAAPHIDMKMGSSIKVEFAYGKCNIFDAKKEVWEPLMNIKESLFPSIGKQIATGVKEINGFARVPYTTQSFPSIAKIIFSADTMKQATGEFTFGGIVSDLNKAAKEKTKEYEESGDLKQQVADAMSAMNNTGPDKNDVAKGRTLLQKVEEGGKTSYTGSNALQYAKYYLTTYKNKEGSDWIARSHADRLIKYADSDKEKDQKSIEDSVNKRQDVFNMVQTEVVDPDNIVVKMKGGHLVAEDSNLKSAEDIEKEQALDKILASLAKLQSRVVGLAVEDLASQAVGSSMSLKFGFDQKFKTSIDEISTYCQQGHNIITLSGIIPTDVSITFDFSNLDENGYPMAGCLEIKNVWSLKVGGEGLSLSSRSTDQSSK